MDKRTIVAIDPGTERSGVVLLSPDGAVADHGVHENESLLGALYNYMRPGATSYDPAVLVIEMIASQGMAVGRETFETCVWIGRFMERWGNRPVRRILRHEVKLALCGNARAKDANIRQALIDRYGPGKDLAIGRKKTPGPLYGIRSHEWSALAVAVTYLERGKDVSRDGAPHYPIG